MPYLTDIEVKFLSNIAHQQGWILTVIPDNNQTITYQLKISDHSNNNYQPVVNSNTSPTSNLNILMQEYIIWSELDTYKLSKAAKAVNEHKICALSSAIYAFLLSGVQPDNKYANMFDVNDASKFWVKLICE